MRRRSTRRRPRAPACPSPPSTVSRSPAPTRPPRCARPVTPSSPTPYTNPRARSHTRGQPIVGRSRRGEHHRLDAGGVGDARTTGPLPRAGRSGRIARIDTGRHERTARTVRDPCGTRCCSTSSPRAGCRRRRRAARRGSTAAWRRGRARAATPPGRPGRPSPDRRTGCRPRQRRRPRRRRPARRRSTRRPCRRSRTARGACGLGRAAARNRFSSSANLAAQDVAHFLHVLVAAAAQVDEHRLALRARRASCDTHASACAGSSAGMIPRCATAA